MKIVVCFGLAWVLGVTSAVSQVIPVGYMVPDSTLSPDHRLGVTVQKNADWLAAQDLPNPIGPKNELIDLKTGHLLGAIQVDPDYVYFEGQNHADLAPTRWSADGAMLLWLVDGKWGFSTEILIKLKDGRIQSQVDVLKLLRREALQRILAAVPVQYAAVKKEGEGDGSWFQDGFSIDCVPDAGNNLLTFPLLFQVFITSDPKGMGEASVVNARMTAELQKDGTIKVLNFRMGKTPAARNW